MGERPQIGWLKPLRTDLRDYWPLWLIVAAAVGLRLYGMGRLPGIIGDEAWYGVQAQRLLAGSSGELRTPTGNVPGLFQLGSLVLLHGILPASALLLRIPALVSSLVAMALAYAVGRRFFGPRQGMAALVLMACLPVTIAYARFGWDPSHAGMFVLAAAYATLAMRRLLAALLFALALANHPAALFAAPFLTLACLGSERDRDAWPPALRQTAGFAALLLMGVLLSLALSPAATHYLNPAQSFARLVDPGQWAAFGLGFVRLLTGQTIYEFVAGRGFGPALPAIDAIAALFLLAVLAAGLIGLWRRFDWLTAGILAGCFASLVSLFFFAGLWVFRPGLERFGVPMIPLAALTVAALLAAFIPPGRKMLFQAVLSLISLPLLAGFGLYYLAPLDRDFSRSGTGLWIGYPNLNQRAFDFIDANAGPGSATVVGEDWWISWPVRYLSANSRSRVQEGSANPAAAKWWIAYRDGPLEHSLRRRGDVRLRSVVKSRNGGNALHVWSAAPPRSTVR